MTLIQAMRSDHPSVEADRSLMHAAALMEEPRCTLLPVIDTQGCLVGVLTALDLIRAYLVGDMDPGSGCVRDVMSVDPVGCPPDSSLDDVRDLMLHQRRTAVPVVQSDGRLLGVVLLLDVVDALTEPRTTTGPESEYVKRVRGEEI
jgi:CBS domain-containing protein